MHAENSAMLAVHDHLDHASVVAEDLPARDLAIARDADLVWDSFRGQLFLRLAHHRDLRDRVDADGKVARHGSGLHAEHVTRGKPTLLCAGCRKGGETNDVARREDVRDRRAKVIIDGQTTTLIAGESRRREIEAVRGTDASGREQNHVGDDALSRLELQDTLRMRTVDH